VELYDTIKTKLNKQLFSPRFLLSKFCLLDESSQLNHASKDPSYLPFYYNLGKELEVKNLAEFGFGLGLLSGSFLLACKTVENFIAIQEPKDEYYSLRIGKANIKRVYRNKLFICDNYFHDKKFSDLFKSTSWDLVIVNDHKSYDEYMAWFNFIWENLRLDGYMCIEHADKEANRAFEELCFLKRREPVIMPTRYGTGLIQK